MPDYTSILKRSISALPDSSDEMREAVYQRARAALARQLTAVDPPLSTREIERQHQELEDAVARLEAEFTPEPNNDAPLEDAAPNQGYLAPEPPPPSSAVVRREPMGRAGPEPIADQRGREPDGDDDDEDDDEEYEDEEERASRLPLLLGLLMLVLVVGGAAAYGYAQRDSLLSFLGLSDAEEQVATADAPPARIVAAEPEQPSPQPGADATQPDDPDKRLDRLTNGAEPPPAPAPPEAPAPVEPEAPLVLPPEDETTAAPLPAESPPGLQEEQTAALEPPVGTDASIVAQRAIFYFQGQEGTPGRATEGTVAWAQITRDNGPAVQATLRLAEQNVTTTVTIYKNNDSTLPASHLVEVQFSGNVGASPIQRVPALVLKQTEQARGQPLTGAAVPVTEDLFWIALSDDEEQIARNLQLLREGSWFDIPILFNDGTRALLTFEKGIPGDRVFETVMSAWTPA